MLLNNINHKMPIYKDCTLGEMLFVGGCTFFSVAIALSSITKILFNFAWIGLAISIVSLVHTTRFLLGRLQKIKYGKPYGYYRHLLIKKLQKNNFIAAFLNIPYIQREGKWSVRRKTC